MKSYGVNDKNLDKVRSYFPKLKIIARGDMIKAIGNDKELDDFEEKFNLLLVNFDKFAKLTELDIEQIIQDKQWWSKFFGR